MCLLRATRALVLLSLLSACDSRPISGADSGPPADFDGGVIAVDGAQPPRDAGTDAGPADAGPQPCDDPGTSETVACGRCGTTTRFCSSDETWVYGPCTGESGVCEPGGVRSSACGHCGTQSERCTVACEWEPVGECSDEGECAPGTTARSAEGCPAGQTRAVACDDACTFAPAGACQDEACPTAGAIETIACGLCGTTTRFCSSELTWSYGPCEGEGVCAPGTMEPVACGACGTRMARCTTACEWDATAACTGEGECTPGELARTDEGCPSGQSRPLTCGATCTYTPGACEIDECVPGATASVACGMCGTRVRTCSDARRWVDGPCTGEGVCMPGTTSMEACGLCGTQSLGCSASCAWLPVGSCTGERVCTPPASTCISTTTLRTYGAASCSAGACSFASTDAVCPAGCSAGACTGPVGLIRGLGGPAGFGTDALASSDDGSSPAILLSPTFAGGLRFYGTDYTSVFVNNNGNLSFGADVFTYTPAFPRASGAPMIAPFFADVDTRGAGQPARNNVHWFMDSTRLIVTWHLVGYYMQHDDLQNSFQLILTNRSDVAPGDFDVELRYERCEWTTGDASGGTGGLGGTPAGAGFDAANGIDSRTLPGSGTAAILNLCTTSNAGIPGLWRFQVRGGVPL